MSRRRKIFGEIRLGVELHRAGEAPVFVQFQQRINDGTESRVQRRPISRALGELVCVNRFAGDRSLNVEPRIRFLPRQRDQRYEQNEQVDKTQPRAAGIVAVSTIDTAGAHQLLVGIFGDFSSSLALPRQFWRQGGRTIQRPCDRT